MKNFVEWISVKLEGFYLIKMNLVNTACALDKHTKISVIAMEIRLSAHKRRRKGAGATPSFGSYLGKFENIRANLKMNMWQPSGYWWSIIGVVWLFISSYKYLWKLLIMNRRRNINLLSLSVIFSLCCSAYLQYIYCLLADDKNNIVTKPWDSLLLSC